MALKRGVRGRHACRADLRSDRIQRTPLLCHFSLIGQYVVQDTYINTSTGFSGSASASDALENAIFERPKSEEPYM